MNTQYLLEIRKKTESNTELSSAAEVCNIQYKSGI